MKDLYVITGGTGGIGLACAKEFDKVLISDINEEGLKNAKTELEGLGIECHTLKCDISKKEDVVSLANAAEEIGGFKGLIHTAGVSGTAPYELVYKVDIIGSKYIVDEFLRFSKPGTAFILIASMNGHLIPANDVYDNILRDCLQEGFIEKMNAFSKEDGSSAYNFSKRGVHLAFMKSITPLNRSGEPEEISAVCKFLLSDSASYITGCDLRVDGGVIPHLQEFAKKKAQQ